MNNETDITKKQLKDLELFLLHTDYRQNPALIDHYLAPEFEEIDSSGKITQRAEVVNWLLNKDTDQRWVLSDFMIKPVSDDVVLAIYRAVKVTGSSSHKLGSIRSSVWRHKQGKWQMIFHHAA